MSLEFFKKIKNNNLEIDKYVENIQKNVLEENIIENEYINFKENDKIEETKENIEKVINFLKEDIKKKEIKYDNYFDNDIKKHLDILHNYISNFIPDYPKYYNGDVINGKAYLDSRDFIKREFPVTSEQILESESTISGLINDTKLNFDNGFSVDSQGNVYDPNNIIIFRPSEPSQIVSHIDLLNKKVVTENGIRVDLPKDFIKENIYENEYIDKEFKDKLKDYENLIEKNNQENKSKGTVNENYINKDLINSTEKIIGQVENIFITEKDRIFIEFPFVEETYLGDIFEEEFTIDLIGQIKKFKVQTESFGTCNFKEIPYAELQSLLLWGGGERGVKPLAGAELSDKDIIFKPDGTVLYSGNNSVMKTKRKGCPSKSYKTGHLMMYSSSNKVGIKRSIIQYIYGFCASVGIFNANIPKLIGFKKFKVFPGLCIGGLLENILCGWQERISTRINELFQCVPSEMPSDNAFSGFENETYPHGCSVESLEELGKIKSCKFGDKFVVNKLEPNFTGLKDYACGQFIYDPNNKLSKTHLWRYKEFSGKPYVEEDVKVIKDFSTMYQNPMIEDILMNTNALGVDSITRKLMSLQFAYLKKEALLTLKDIEASMDDTIQATIFDALDKLTSDISRYVYMKELHTLRKSKVPNFESNQYCNEFFEHFKFLTDNNILKMPELKKHKRTYTIATNNSGGSNGEGNTSYEYIDYYDFNSLNKEEYLVPRRDYVDYYDMIMFAEKFSPNQRLKELYESNLNYYGTLQGDIGKYKKIKTMRDFINISILKEEINRDISDNLTYIKADLEYDGYEISVFYQTEKRCYYLIDNKKIFG